MLITHFHLDHCGALPYFTEMIGYNGPIYMTLPTKAIAPILLEDMRKVIIYFFLNWKDFFLPRVAELLFHNSMRLSSA